jgi:hypothetical protein
MAVSRSPGRPRQASPSRRWRRPTRATTPSVITDPAGIGDDLNGRLTVNPAGGPPVPVSIVLQPAARLDAGGRRGDLHGAAVTGDASITYQWRKNQSNIAGATGPSFTIFNVQARTPGPTTSWLPTASRRPTRTRRPSPSRRRAPEPPRQRLGARIHGTGGNALTVGFVVGGTGSESRSCARSAPRSPFGVTGVLLADPKLTLFGANQAVLATNDGWGGTAALSAAFAQTGAFALPSNSLDAALESSLPVGAYTAQVRGERRRYGRRAAGGVRRRHRRASQPRTTSTYRSADRRAAERMCSPSDS